MNMNSKEVGKQKRSGKKSKTKVVRGQRNFENETDDRWQMTTVLGVKDRNENRIQKTDDR